jgi:hypothetical protein
MPVAILPAINSWLKPIWSPARSWMPSRRWSMRR